MSSKLASDSCVCRKPENEAHPWLVDQRGGLRNYWGGGGEGGGLTQKISKHFLTESPGANRRVFSRNGLILQEGTPFFFCMRAEQLYYGTLLSYALGSASAEIYKGRQKIAKNRTPSSHH